MLIEQNVKFDYILYNFNFIKKNYIQFVEDSHIAHQRFLFHYPNKSSTWLYNYYNIMCLSLGSVLYYRLFKKLSSLIRSYSKTKEPLWLQSWLNFHNNKTLLDWHNHTDCSFHGFVCIDPKNTITEFENFKIENKVGNVYLGPSNLNHRVVSLEPFESQRITLGFDVYSISDVESLYSRHGKIDVNVGMIPV